MVDLFPQVVHALMDLPQRGDLVFPGVRGGRLKLQVVSQSDLGTFDGKGRLEAQIP